MREFATTLPLKYRLTELMSMVPRTFTIGDITRVLEAEYGISKSSFYKHKQLPAGSPHTISEGDLAKYAAFFGVTEKEVRNYQPVDRMKSRTVFDILKTTAPFTQEVLEKMTGITVPAGR